MLRHSNGNGVKESVLKEKWNVAQKNGILLLYMAQHWKNKLDSLNSVNSIITLAIPLLYAKHYSFLHVPEMWEANSEAGIFLTISNRSSWIDSVVWIRQSDAEE